MKRFFALSLLLAMFLCACGTSAYEGKAWETEAYFNPSADSLEHSQLLCKGTSSGRSNGHLVISFLGTTGPTAFDIHVDYEGPNSDTYNVSTDFSLTELNARAVSIPKGAAYAVTATATAGQPGTATFQISIS